MPPPGCILFYTLLEADLVKKRDNYYAMNPANTGLKIPPPSPPASTLVMWLIDADGVQCMERRPATASDGRSLEQLCTDATTKLTLSFGDAVTRGPPISEEVPPSPHYLPWRHAALPPPPPLATRGMPSSPNLRCHQCDTLLSSQCHTLFSSLLNLDHPRVRCTDTARRS